MGVRMSAKLLIVIVALCVSQVALAASHKRPRDVQGAPAPVPATPYKADRLSSSRGETILDTSGQTTVLTRQVLDDMNATTLRDAMRSTAGVTIGR